MTTTSKSKSKSKSKSARSTSGSALHARMTVDVKTDDSTIHIDMPKWRAANMAEDIKQWGDTMASAAAEIFSLIRGPTFVAPVPAPPTTPPPPTEERN
jgi:hypothetical protein